MERLCRTFLSVPLETVLHPPSAIAREAVKEQKVALLTDTLTGLPNLREFESRLEGALMNAKERQGRYALAYLDLDDFGTISQMYGRSTGDDLLKQIAGLLKSKMHSRDTLARLHADHFGILFENCSVEEALRASNTLREAIAEQSFSCSGLSLNIRASIGVTDVSPEHHDAASVVSSAVHACRIAKEAGGNAAHGLRTNSIEQVRSSDDTKWKERITRALEENRLILHRQTMRALGDDTKSDTAYELLVQMSDERGAQLHPDVFSTAASRSEMWPRIDRWVIQRALRWLQTPGPEVNDLTLCSINISGESIRDEGFLPYVIEQLRDSAVDATKLCLELTETAITENMSRSRYFTRQLELLGCRFALDNFGTGYSSLSYLKEPTPDFLKIDGSFVGEITRDRAAAEIVRTITALARTLGIQTIAEGVEDRETENLLRSLGVDYAQGYWISMPRTL